MDGTKIFNKIRSWKFRATAIFSRASSPQQDNVGTVAPDQRVSFIPDQSYDEEVGLFV
jgi:hypothetical protein